MIVTGDLNSDPVHPVEPPIVPPYAQFVSAGFTDVWLERSGPLDLGYTCCQEEDLTNPVSFLDERVDHVLLRNAGDGPSVGPVTAQMVWRSDTRRKQALNPSSQTCFLLRNCAAQNPRRFCVVTVL